MRLGFAASLAFLLVTDSATSAPPTVPPPAEFCGTMQSWMASPQGKDFSRKASLTGTCLPFGACDTPANRDAAIPNGSTAVKLVRLRFQVLANDDGSNVAVTPAEIAAQVDKLNTDFEASRIQFVYSIRTNLSTLYRNCPSNAEPALKAAFSENPAQQLNVFVTRYTFANCGIATFPFSPSSLTSNGGMLLQDWSVAPVRTGFAASFFGCSSHEMGHMLGLLHTFRGTTEWTTDCQNCKELAGRNTFDGDRTGDFCSDTAPDPGVTVITAPCNPTGTDSCNTLSYTNIDTLNIMSYYIGCQSRFTPQQMGRMHCWMGSSLSSTYFFDAVNPGVAILTPTNGTVAPSVSIATGTASDDNAVKRVRVALARTADGWWWDWVNGVFATNVFDFVRHTKWADGTTTWTKTLPSLPSGAYQVHAQSIDLADHASVWQVNQFTIDTSSPTIAFSPLTNQQVVFNFEQLGGTISEAATVKFKIEWFKAGGNEFWNGGNWSSFAGAGAELAANVAGLNWTPAPGTLPPRAQLAQANYIIHAYVTDAAGNTNYHNLVLSRSPLDTTPPLATINIGEGEVFTNNFLPALQGLAGDAESGVDLVTMYFARRVAGGFEYWNGSSWSDSSSVITLSYQDFVWGMPGGTPQPGGANLRNGSYNIQVIARNREVPALSGSVSVNFVVDWHPVYIWTAGSFSDGDPNNNNYNWDNPANWSPYGLPPAEASVFINGNPEARPFAFINVYGLTHSGGTLYTSNLNVKFLTQHGGRIHCENILQLGSNGVFRWNGGEFYGGAAKLGSLNVPTSGTVIITNTAGKAVYSATFNNSGTVRWFEGHIYGDESVMNNGPTGLWEASGPYALNLYPSFGAGNRGLVNHGTFRKLGSVETAHQGYFNNFGVLEVQAGLFTFYDAMRWENGSRITGAGTVRLVNGCCGATAQLSGTSTLEAIFELSEYNTHLRGPGVVNLGSTGVVRLINGYVDDAVTFTGSGTVDFVRAGFTGTATIDPGVTVNMTSNERKQIGARLLNRGTINWSAGWIDGGILENSSAGLLTVPPSGVVTIYSCVVTNNGMLRLATNAQFWGGNSSRLDNRGVVEMLDDSYFAYNNSGGSIAFNNLPGGVLRKVGGGVAQFAGFYGGWLLNNTGNLDAPAGTLLLQNYTKNLYTGGTTTGAGRVKVSAGRITLAGVTQLTSGSTLELATGAELVGTGALAGPGTFVWSGGSVTAGANASLETNVQMVISSSDGKWLNGGSTFTNHGTVTVLGSGTITFSSGSVFNNRGLFNLQTTNVMFFYDNGGAYPAFRNLPGGTLRNAGGVTDFNPSYGGIAFHNSGLVEATAGALKLGGGGTSDGEFRAQAAGVIEFTAATHTWNTGAKVSGNSLTRIVGAAVNLGGTVDVSSTLELTTGSLGGAGVFTGGGLIRWNGGAIYATATLPATMTMNIQSSAGKYLGGGQLQNFGTVNLLDDGVVTFGTGASFTNSGVFHAQGRAALDYNNAGAGVAFYNQPGAVLRQTGGMTNTFAGAYGGVRFYNQGALDIQAGVLQLDNVTKVLGDGGSVSGAGRVRSLNGTLSLDGLTTFSGGTVELATANLSGLGAFQGTGTFEWSGGALVGVNFTTGSGITTRITSAAGKWFTGGSVVTNFGTVLVTAPAVTFSQGSVYHNAGWFEMQANSTFDYDNGGAYPAFKNLPGGTFRNSGVLANFHPNYGGISFHNHGLVHGLGGTLQFGGGGGTSSGEFRPEGGGVIEFTAGAHTWNNGVNVSGNGFTRIVGAAVNLAGTVNVSSTLELTTGSLGGAGVFTGGGLINWNGGAIYAAATFPATMTMSIQGNAEKYLGGGQLQNFGTVQLLDAGPLTFGTGARFTNSGVFVGQGNAAIGYNNAGATTEFYNEPGAVFRRVNGATTNTFSPAYGGVAFYNRGTLDIQAGMLRLQNGWKVLYGGTVISGAGRVQVDGGTINLAGTSTLNGGTLEFFAGTMNGAGTFAGNGVFDWSGGSIAGATITNSPSTLILASAGPGRWFGSSRLENLGTIRVLDPGSFTMSQGAVLNNAGLFDLRTNTVVFYDNGGAPPFFNNLAGATLRKSASTGVAYFSGAYGGVRFQNDGVVEVRDGTLGVDTIHAMGGGASTRVELGGATPGTGYTRETYAGTANLNGSLEVSLRPGYVPTNGESFNVIGYAARNGVFQSIALPVLPAGWEWKTRYDATALTLSTKLTPACLNLTNGLIAWWPGHSGTNLMNSGDVAPVNGATNSPGYNGTAFLLDGNNDYWSVPDSTNFRPANLTVEGWVNFSGYGGLRTFFGKPYGAGVFDSFTVWLQDTTLHGVLTTPSGFGPILSYPLTPQLGRWYHMAFTFDDTNDTQTLYLDGVAVAASAVTGSIVYDTRPFIIGADIENGSPAFFHHGQIDEVTLYDRALSAGDLAAIYAADSIGRCALTMPPAPVVRLLNSSWSNGVFQAVITAPMSAARAIVEASGDLQTWTPIQTNAPFTGMFLLVDPAAVAPSNRFYRVRLEP